MVEKYLSGEASVQIYVRNMELKLIIHCKNGFRCIIAKFTGTLGYWGEQGDTLATSDC